MSFHPQYVTDESMNPVAVLIPYAEWLKISKKLGLKTPERADGFLEPVVKPSSKIEEMAADARKAHKEGKTRKFPA